MIGSNRALIGVIIGIFCVITVACKDSFDQSLYPSIIKPLSSEKLEGRLTGTAGNEQAQQLIVDYFQKFGLSPFSSDSFLHPYAHRFFPPGRQAVHIAIVKQDGSREELREGIDYMENVAPFHAVTEAPATFQTDDRDLGGKIILLEDSKSIAAVAGKKPQAIFVKRERLMRMLPHQESELPFFQLTPEAFGKLKSRQSEIKSISIAIDHPNEQIQANNVIGMIKSAADEEHREAMVISAHFDGLGSLDKNRIFRGAVDNAGGVAALIQLAYSFKQYSAKNPVHADLIFAAFNGEESGLQGSRAFLTELSGKYEHLYNINLDTVGEKDGGPVLVTGSKTSPFLIDSMVDYFKKHEIQATGSEAGPSSDHESFTAKGIPAVTIGSSNYPVIHTTEDIEDEIDLDRLSKVTTAVFNFILEDRKIHESGLQSGEGQELAVGIRSYTPAQMNLIQETQNKLKLGEYGKFTDGKGFNFNLFQNYGETRDATEFERYVPGLNLPQAIGPYAFYSASLWVHVDSADYILKLKENDKARLDHLPIESIELLGLMFKNASGEGIHLRLKRIEASWSTGQAGENEGDTGYQVEPVDYEGTSYSLLKTDKSLLVGTERTIQGKTFHIEVYRGKDSAIKDQKSPEPVFALDWRLEDRDEAIRYVHELGLEQIIQDLGLVAP